MRTEFAKAYQTSEDIVTYVVNSQKIQFKDERGEWQEIDNEIIKNPDTKSDYELINKSNDFVTEFGIKDGKAVSKVSKGKYSVEFSINSNSRASMSTESLLRKNNNEYLNEFDAQSNAIVYKDVFNDADLVYSVKGDELKEDIVLYNKPDFNEISYTFTCTNLNFEKTIVEYKGYNESTGEETIYNKEVGIFVDSSTGEKIFEMKDFFMMDSDNHFSDDLLWDYVKTGEDYTITIYLDSAFLESSDIKYPVIVDPTVSGSSVTYDTYASRKYPNNNYYLNNYVRTGKDSSYGIRRTFIKWTLPTVADKYPIKDMEIQLKMYSMDGIALLNAKRLTTSWSSSALTWWNSPNSVSTYETTSGTWSSGWYLLDITDIGERWYCGMYNNYGVKIYDDNESNENIWATFCSSDYSTTSYNPKLVISYCIAANYWSRYNYGYGSSSIVIDNDCSTYSAEVYTAASAWNAAGDDWDISFSTSSPNKVSEVYYISGDKYGNYHYENGNFQITISTSKIGNNKEWDKMAQSILVHELGHALWLEDQVNDNDSDYDEHTYCIMGYGRDRNVMIYPTASDIAGVDTKW